MCAHGHGVLRHACVFTQDETLGYTSPPPTKVVGVMHARPWGVSFLRQFCKLPLMGQPEVQMCLSHLEAGSSTRRCQRTLFPPPQSLFLGLS